MNRLDKFTWIDKLILIYLMIEVLILRWISSYGYYKYFHILILFIIIFRNKNNRKIRPSDILVILFYLTIIFLNILNNGINSSFRFLKSFYLYGLSNLIVILYIMILSYRNKGALKNFILKEMFIIFNAYFIINIPIIIKQLEGTYFLMRNVEGNPMYEDHITGLIGASGTHQLTFFWIILIIINLYSYFTLNRKFGLVSSIIYIPFMIIVSSQNDNTAFFLLFPFIVGQYLLYRFIFNKNISFFSIVKIIFLTMSILFLFTAVYKNNDNVKNFVDGKVTRKLVQYGVIDGVVDEKYGNDEERIFLYKYALEYGNGYKLGNGIGSIELYGDLSMPKHFGMSEISIRVYEGGLIYLFSIILIFSHFINRIYIMNNKYRGELSFLIICGNLVVLSIYTQVFQYMVYCLVLALIAFILNDEYSKQHYIL